MTGRRAPGKDPRFPQGEDCIVYIEKVLCEPVDGGHESIASFRWFFRFHKSREEFLCGSGAWASCGLSNSVDSSGVAVLPSFSSPVGKALRTCTAGFGGVCSLVRHLDQCCCSHI
jgi:hypothetical protein